MKAKFRLYFYLISYSFIVISAIIGLIINNKTMTLNDRIMKLSALCDKLEEENKTLELSVLKETSLEHLESVSLSMGLKPSSHLFYLKAIHVQ